MLFVCLLYAVVCSLFVVCCLLFEVVCYDALPCFVFLFFLVSFVVGCLLIVVVGARCCLWL